MTRHDLRKRTGLILALDVLSADRADLVLGSAAEFLDAVKVGYPLILAAGLPVVSCLAERLPVIADLKVADIPNTNRLICDQVFDAGASGIIAHAFPGQDSLQACADSAAQAGAALYVVTEMSHPGAQDFMAVRAEDMARLAVEVGAAGVVAPATRPQRISAIRKIIGPRIIISPGVGAQGGTAASALKAGADFLIAGRSIYEAKDPGIAAQELAYLER
ncbi:MAG: Orotidine 5'-phosphate decarboxylase [Methanosaeta sp. PtaB.Bin039]|nr:MAG: Orotidine 5'-phosphate decarboxylase [Methanosaeta sp. PtaB.Bin039]OPY45871.1 MAG: Orotidine 5'-phosphate decarboxylase [Methanosaeta sp. PtaU1.Bin028]HOT07823.1 orotidine-5'-phosphate decarboxylase [Methanotrichaceae archaeon]HQF17544.1 orotidine-5'-phosphate decarboxylase [Methanotrichaceae archaeon]HQI92114.1 orotidine-5'-phosphate decarboxylase [Methanotrichaceae archaeon]